MYSQTRSQSSVERVKDKSVSHRQHVLVSEIVLVRRREYREDIRWVWGPGPSQIYSKSVRSLHQLDVGGELWRKCLIWRYLKNGMWRPGNAEDISGKDRREPLRYSWCALICVEQRSPIPVAIAMPGVLRDGGQRSRRRNKVKSSAGRVENNHGRDN